MQENFTKEKGELIEYQVSEVVCMKRLNLIKESNHTNTEGEVNGMRKKILVVMLMLIMIMATGGMDNAVYAAKCICPKNYGVSMDCISAGSSGHYTQACIECGGGKGTIVGHSRRNCNVYHTEKVR